jgi:hypothetical protein
MESFEREIEPSSVLLFFHLQFFQEMKVRDEKKNHKTSKEANAAPWRSP